MVNRLRQVTSAIRQDGANRVSIITNSAERRAAIEFAKAQAMRPQIVGEALSKINADAEVAQAMFEILETENMLKDKTRITLIPKGNELMRQMIGAETTLTNTE